MYMYIARDTLNIAFTCLRSRSLALKSNLMFYRQLFNIFVLWIHIFIYISFLFVSNFLFYPFQNVQTEGKEAHFIYPIVFI